MKLTKSDALALAGAAVGGLLGYFIFSWLLGTGLYGMMIPGGLLGLSAGYFKSKSLLVAILCGIAALALGLFAEWKFFPFNADGSFGYFLAHVHELRPMTLFMIAIGAAVGFWGTFRHRVAKPTSSGPSGGGMDQN